MTRRLVLFLSLLVLLFTTGCYFNDEIEQNQVAVQTNGGKIEGCVGPGGVYTDMGFFADLKEMNIDTLTFGVEDPEVATKDNQPVRVEITIQARRKWQSCDDVKNLFSNWLPLLQDQALIETVSATAKEGIKVGTRSFTLNQLLDDRNGLSTAILNALTEDASKYSVEIVNVTVEDIGLDPEYSQVLKDRAIITAQIDQELRRQDLLQQQAETNAFEQEQRIAVLQQQLVAEQAETAIQVEIASREGEVINAKNAVYLDNEAAFELEKLRLLKEIYGDKAVFYFIPGGTDIDLLLNQAGTPQVLPVSPGD